MTSSPSSIDMAVLAALYLGELSGGQDTIEGAIERLRHRGLVVAGSGSVLTDRGRRLGERFCNEPHVRSDGSFFAKEEKPQRHEEHEGPRKASPLPERVERTARDLIDSVVAVHRALGPGLLESTYSICLARELAERDIPTRREVPIGIEYRDIRLEAGYRIDMLVDESIILELKSVEIMHPVFEAQLLTYMKLSGHRLGFLINFNVRLAKHGIRRFIL